MSSANQRPARTTEESDTLTAERRAALRQRVAQLMTPEEHARLLMEIWDNAAEIVAIGQRLLNSKHP